MDQTVVKGRSYQATEYKKLVQLIKSLNKNEFDERFKFWE